MSTHNKVVSDKNGRHKKEWKDCPQKFGRRMEERKYKKEKGVEK
jgi:hypothetical protein